MPTPLTVLDLVPISSGSTATQALHNSIDLARRAESLGYTRYWFAEHHLNPGVAGTSPAVLLALTAAETSTIRLGSGALQMGHRTALSTVEEFGLLDALHPGRFDLGLGRFGGKPVAPTPSSSTSRTVVNGHAPNGLPIPAKFDPTALLKSPRLALQKALLQLPDARPQHYTEQVGDILALIGDTYRAANGEVAHIVPGRGADLQIWILGSSGGESAMVAGKNGLRFAANYHVTPSAVLEAADGYRAAFSPSADLDKPCVSVSADVVVALRATVSGCAASAPLRARSHSPLRTRRAATGGPMPTVSSSRTGSKPSSSEQQCRLPTSWSYCVTPPGPTSSSSPPSPTTTKTACVLMSCLRRSGRAGECVQRPADDGARVAVVGQRQPRGVGSRLAALGSLDQRGLRPPVGISVFVEPLNGTRVSLFC
jgi:alkanesulfonate monooxygenase SsuD/methylene tetrahydromethanopterin reductase-like flavin-dependent oxidoreductase (luciferase family)